VIALRHDLLALYGPAFQRAAGVVVVLTCAQAVSGCLGLTGWTLVVAGRSRVMLLANLGGAIVNVTLNLILVPRLGLLGAAVASLVTVTLFQLGLIAATWGVERVHPFQRAQLKPLVAAGVAFAAQAVLPHPHATAARVAAVILCVVSVYAAALVALGLSDEERRALARLRERL
jgi:O-antigen/teichoic acid export membrane protein